MSTLELKKDLKKKIDLLTPNKFKKVYGSIVNTMNTEMELDEWMGLGAGERSAIEKGLLQAEQGKIHSHNHVMKELFKKYAPKG